MRAVENTEKALKKQQVWMGPGTVTQAGKTTSR